MTASPQTSTKVPAVPKPENLDMAKPDNPKPPSLTEKTLSIRIPDEKHRALKARCALDGVPIRSVLLAMLSLIHI